jgi:hypothetical protein
MYQSYLFILFTVTIQVLYITVLSMGSCLIDLRFSLCVFQCVLFRCWCASIDTTATLMNQGFFNCG